MQSELTVDRASGVSGEGREPRKTTSENSKKVTSNDEIAQVGTISANGDREIGDFLAKESATKA